MKVQRLHRSGHSWVLTIPRAVMLELGWLPQETVVFEVKDGTVILEASRRLQARARRSETGGQGEQ